SGAESEVFAMYNGNTQQIVVHGPDGSVERVIGGAGSGPGEFRRITAFFLSGDTLHVFDGPGGRISYMTPDGAYLGGRSLSVVPNRAVQVPGRRYIISANI